MMASPNQFSEELPLASPERGTHDDPAAPICDPLSVFANETERHESGSDAADVLPAAPSRTLALVHPRNVLLLIGVLVLAVGTYDLVDAVRESLSSSTADRPLSTPSPSSAPTAAQSRATPPLPAASLSARARAQHAAGLQPDARMRPRETERRASQPSRSGEAAATLPIVVASVPSDEAPASAPAVSHVPDAPTDAPDLPIDIPEEPATAEPAIESAASSESAGRVASDAEHAAVHDLLARYAAALQQRDVATTAQIWPSVDRATLSRAFATVKAQGITLGSCVLAVSDEEASARCHGSIWFVPKVGRSDRRASGQDWVFTMKKQGEAWKIQQVTATVPQSAARAEQEQR